MRLSRSRTTTFSARLAATVLAVAAAGALGTAAANGAIAWQDDRVNNGCALGVHGPWALDTANSGVTNGGTYYTVATMVFTNGTSSMAISVNETLSY